MDADQEFDDAPPARHHDKPHSICSECAAPVDWYERIQAMEATVEELRRSREILQRAILDSSQT